MAQLTAFSSRAIGNRERLEDFAADATIVTAGGLNLQIGLVCDGAGGGEVGELAARLTARTILGFLEISTETIVPKLLIKAVEEANRVVFAELHSAGTSTVALAVVHLDDSPHGRLYLASVGDSRIYLLRGGQCARLNIDHTLANEYARAGQMTTAETAQLENADYATRVIGVSPTVAVDIGFYAERGRDFVNSRRAFRIGKHGLALKAGDTILVASDGPFDTNSEDGQPFLHEEELLHHALDDDVERAMRALMRYTTTRRPADNIAMSLLFVPARERKAVRVSGELSRRQRVGRVAALAVAIGLATILGILLLRTGKVDSASQATQAAGMAFARTMTQIIAEQSYTPTSTNTPTPTSTSTPTPTPTLRPTVVGLGQVGNQFFAPGSSNPITPVFERTPLGVSTANPDISYLAIEGAAGAQGLRNIDSADFYLQPQTNVEFTEVDDALNQELLRMLLYSEGDLFAQIGEFAVGGVEISTRQDTRITFISHAPCIAARQIPADPLATPGDTDKIALSCYNGVGGDCQYRFGWGRETPMPIGRRVVLDIQQREAIGTPGPILYEEAQLYYDTIATLVGEDQTQCLLPYLDDDEDGVRYPLDQCPGLAGSDTAAGCPDRDRDGVPDRLGEDVEGVTDRCPNVPGPVENAGCPDVTATPTRHPSRTPTSTPSPTPPPAATQPPPPTQPSDSDGDGVPDNQEDCDQDPNKTTPGVCGCGNPDTDTDGDGVADCIDSCDDDPGKTDPGVCGCGTADDDSDSDGTEDCHDGCPSDPDKTAPGLCGCGVADDDSDSDGTEDCHDGCPSDPDKTAPGICGCGTPDTDSDNDGTPNCNDLCPDDPGKTNPGHCGCGTADTDSDGDGEPDCHDQCPNDPGKVAPGVCGCGVADTDSDNDGTPDCNDGCPSDPAKTAPGVCGCGVADTDSDNDGTPDCNDGCPSDPAKTAPGVCGCNVASCCGDTTCNPDEDCNSCPGDCGECPPSCGNGNCQAGEDCASCPDDCCPPSPKRSSESSVCGNSPSGIICRIARLPGWLRDIITLLLPLATVTVLWRGSAGFHPIRRLRQRYRKAQ